MRVEGLTPVAIPRTLVPASSQMYIAISAMETLAAVRLVLPPTRLQLAAFRVGSRNLVGSISAHGIDLGVGLDWFLPEPLLHLLPGVGAQIEVHNPTAASVIFEGAALWCRQ